MLPDHHEEKSRIKKRKEIEKDQKETKRKTVRHFLAVRRLTSGERMFSFNISFLPFSTGILPRNLFGEGKNDEKCRMKKEFTVNFNRLIKLAC
ncbi:hypothetical protein TNCV_1108611 [Trichonephila clavipes]|nr:hypothetical protein TNCV_1108611 [Trichonephila clavipes]